MGLRGYDTRGRDKALLGDGRSLSLELRAGEDAERTSGSVVVKCIHNTKKIVIGHF